MSEQVEEQNNLKQRREAAGVSQRRLAKRAGMSRRWVDQVEQSPVQVWWLGWAQTYLNALEAEAALPRPKLGRPKKSEDAKT